MLKVYQVGDYDLYAAETGQQALDLYRKDEDLEESGSGEDFVKAEVRELSDAELDAELPETDENGALTGRMTSIRRWLSEKGEPGWLAWSDS